MSGRLLSRSSALLSRRTAVLSRQLHHAGGIHSGGLLRTQGNGYYLRARLPLSGGRNWIHNVPAVRSISFARIIPKLAMKLVRVPAMFGGAMIAGLAYLQYQAARTFLYLWDLRCLLYVLTWYAHHY